MFYGTSGVLTLVATHHPNLDFPTIYREYADGWSPEPIHALGESLLPHAQLVAEQVSAQWVMDARCANAPKGTYQEDTTQPIDGVELRLEANATPASVRAKCCPAGERATPTFVGHAISRCRRAATVGIRVKVV